MMSKGFMCLVLIGMAMLLFLSYSVKNSTRDLFAQIGNKITITLVNSSFAPLSTVHGNQLSVSVGYKAVDKSMNGEKINGVMKVYSSNGSLIHSSSFPDGFKVKKKGDIEEFKTTFRNPTIQSVTANVSFTDLSKREIISNTISTNLQLQTNNTK